ncbi:MAG TPA: hypothetical protein VG818_01140 [Gemmatimonadaceae bacterium]|nr:hypothetical protein [Gemmatimonadaceae bacterium]
MKDVKVPLLVRALIGLMILAAPLGAQAPDRVLGNLLPYGVTSNDGRFPGRGQGWKKHDDHDRDDRVYQARKDRDDRAWDGRRDNDDRAWGVQHDRDDRRWRKHHHKHRDRDHDRD